MEKKRKASESGTVAERKMDMRITANKPRLYKLVKDKGGNVPPMKETEYECFMEAYWLDYYDTQSGHRTTALYGVCAGRPYLWIKDECTGKIQSLFPVSRELLNRGMLTVERAG